MSGRSLIHVYEHDTLQYTRLSSSSVETLEEISKKHRAAIFSFYRDHLQTHQYVGLVQTSSETIQILPKIFKYEELDNLGFLILLLRLTGAVNVRATGSAELSRLNGSFLEIWMRYFATELHRLLQQRFRRAYVEVERRTAHIRGKLRMEAMHSGIETLTGRYPCRFERFTADHRLNQVLKFCNRLLLEQTQNPRTSSLLRANQAFLRNVEDRITTTRDIDRIHLNRLNRDYESLLELCRLLLNQATLDVRAGRISQFTFVFDMNLLFEKGMANLIKHLGDQIRIGGRKLTSVETQPTLGQLFGLFRMNVDLVLEDEDGKRILLDTKYKRLNESTTHGGLSQSDFYQMHAYATAGARSYDTVILLYPSPRRICEQYTSHHTELHVRSINPQLFYDAETGRLNRTRAAKELNEALDLTTRKSR